MGGEEGTAAWTRASKSVRYGQRSAAATPHDERIHAMANEAISRRAILPAAVAGAAALALAEPGGAATTGKRFAALAGPVWITPGQTLVSCCFLPAVQTPADVRQSQFQTSLWTTGGTLLGTVQQMLTPGHGASVKLQALADGSVRLNGNLVDLMLSPGEQAGIIAILIGLLLPAVMPPAASIQCSNNLRTEQGEEAGLGPVTYLLPYIEQDNLLRR